jgi:hypothetical protein
MSAAAKIVHVRVVILHGAAWCYLVVALLLKTTTMVPSKCELLGEYSVRKGAKVEAITERDA